MAKGKPDSRRNRAIQSVARLIRQHGVESVLSKLSTDTLFALADELSARR